MPNTAKRKFQNRIASRNHKHGKNWRQTFVDCGGMCLTCWAVDTLEFHEPFGEDKYGWGMLQARILLCHDCHNEEHDEIFGGDRSIKPSHLARDINIELILEGGYDDWIKNHKLIDRLGYLLVQRS